MTKILSISVADSEKEYLESMDLSPTALFKQKLSEIMASGRAQAKRVEALEINIQKLQDRIALFYRFLETEKMFEKYANFENNVLEKKTDSN